jgi:hypothetical protein
VVIEKPSAFGGNPAREYDVLCERIHQYQRLRVQILAFTVAAVVAMAGLVLRLWTMRNVPESTPTTYIVLAYSFAPFLILIPSCLLTVLLSRNISYLGAYIGVFHEAGQGYWGWELRNFLYIREKRWNKLWHSTKVGFTLSYVLLGMFSYGLCYYNSQILKGTSIGTDQIKLCFMEFTLVELISGTNMILLLVLFAFILFLLFPVIGQDGKYRFLNNWLDVHNSLRCSDKAPMAWLEGGCRA